MFKECPKLAIRKDILTHKKEIICAVSYQKVHTKLFGDCLSHKNGYCNFFKKNIYDIN